MLDQSQEHAKQMEQASNALGKDSVHDLKTKLKEKTDQAEDLAQKLKQIEDRN